MGLGEGTDGLMLLKEDILHYYRALIELSACPF